MRELFLNYEMGQESKCTCIIFCYFYCKVSQQRVSVLTDQLTASEKRERELERALEETRTRLRKVEKQISLHEHGDELLQKRVHCLQTLCCLTVTVRMDGEKTIYSCTVDDGQLMGKCC